MMQNEITPNLCYLLAHVFAGSRGVLSVPGRLGWTYFVLTALRTGPGPQLSWLSGLEGWGLSNCDLSSSRIRDWFGLL